jgi:hypothetical protein
MVNRDSRCGNCRFWQNQNIIGLCKRYPAHHNKHESDWCGEFGAKQPEIVALPVVEMPVEKPVEKRKYTRRQNVQTTA